MNPLDPNKTKAVWDRVLANQGEAPVSAMNQSESAQPVCAGEVMELMHKERNAACGYLALAKLVRGGDCRCLQQMAQEALCRVKQLAAVYYVLTGSRACVCPDATEPVTCLPETLRQQHQAEIEAVSAYEAMAQRESAYQSLFWQLADGRRRNSQKLLCLLQRYL